MNVHTASEAITAPLVHAYRTIRALVILLVCFTISSPTEGWTMQAGASKRDITVPELLGNPQVHDPLFARALVLDDGDSSVAIICLDLGVTYFPEVRERIRTELGISVVLENCSHMHAHERPRRKAKWREVVGQLIFDAVKEAQANRVPVSLHAGRERVEFGHNRYGDAFTQDVVPWVNVLEARTADGKKLAVLFENATHPVMATGTGMISADFPASAIKRINEELGDEVLAMFAQGCGGNINPEFVGAWVEGDPFPGTEKAGRRLGDAVLAALGETERIKTEKFVLRSETIQLPCQLPTLEQWEETARRIKTDAPREFWDDNDVTWKYMAVVKGMVARGEEATRDFSSNVVMLGSEWGLVTMTGEIFSEYELWINAFAPFEHNMVFGYTNAYADYVPTDRALAMGAKTPIVAETACMEAAGWPGFFHGTNHLSRTEGSYLPYAVGIEGMIQQSLTSLWADASDKNAAQGKKTAAVESPTEGWTMQAGASKRDITVPELLGNPQVHDPLFARALVLDDGDSSVAIICLDLGVTYFPEVRERIRKELGISLVLENCSHMHANQRHLRNDKWRGVVGQLIFDAVKEAQAKRVPVSLHAGRERVEFGHNRYGDAFTQDVVPWVNVLQARTEDGKTLAVLFENATHPVMATGTDMISADFPAYAIKRINEELGDEVMALFAQGCGGNINPEFVGAWVEGDPFPGTEKAGRRLGDAVLAALGKTEQIKTEKLVLRSETIKLPCQLPTLKQWEETARRIKSDAPREFWDDNDGTWKYMAVVKGMVARGERPTRDFASNVVMLGSEWGLVTMTGEIFSEYELWINAFAPFERNMVFGYTNTYADYIPTDKALAMGAKTPIVAETACMEAAGWPGFFHGTNHLSRTEGSYLPYAVGIEGMIQQSLTSLWADASDKNAAQGKKTAAVEPVKPAADAPQPLSPAQSAAKIHMPDGFRIDLVASEPLIADPSSIAFDERGRLFVCELHGYNIEGHIDVTELNKTGVLDKTVRRIRWELEFKNGRVAREAAKLQHGVVKLLSDTNGDGVMDKVDVWAKDLPPCYGVVAARGGIIVVCAPDIVFLADRDGDGKAEVRETLFTGFRRAELERGINNPRWGFDNWIYVGSGDRGGTIRGPHLKGTVELGSSDFRIKADGSAIEPVNGTVGTFGMTMNSVGDRFPGNGEQPARYALPLPRRYLTRNPYVPTPRTTLSAANYVRGFRVSQPHPWRVRRRKDPAWIEFYGEKETDSNFFSGGCSNEYYGDDVFPRDYHGSIFYCEPSLNIIHRTVLRRDGAGYTARRAAGEERSEFLASEDQWFRPMNLRVGPDGALYVVDMYREIIEDYSAIPRFLQQQYGLARGTDRGRIWRLAPKTDVDPASTGLSNPDFSKLSGAELVREIGSPRAWRRMTAQRLLIERGDAGVAEALSARVRAGASRSECLHALYTLDGLGKLRSTDVARALDHEDYGVRLHALRLADGFLAEKAMLAKVASMTGDADPSVRLQLAMTLGQSRDPSAVEALLTLARQRGSERWMSTAILSSSRDNAGAMLLRLLSRTEWTPGERALLTPLATTMGGRRDGRRISRTLTAIGNLNATIQVACLRGLVDGLSRGEEPVPTSTDGWAPLAMFLKGKPSEVRDLATKLATRLSLADAEPLNRIFREASEKALASAVPVAERLRAAQLLASAPFGILAATATQLLDAKEPPALQHAAIVSLGASGDDRVGKLLCDEWPSLTPDTRSVALKTILSRQNRLPALLDAIETRVVRPAELSEIQREQLTASRDSGIAARAMKLFENPKSTAELDKRVALYQKALGGKPDLKRGREVFSKTCANCHKLKDEGQEVGPPLGTIINRPDEAILLDVLDPNSNISSEYASYLVVTNKGVTFTGILASESATSVTIRKEKGEEDVILRKDIALMKASEVSLMPSNLHEQIPPQDLGHLIGFLRQAFTAEEK